MPNPIVTILFWAVMLPIVGYIFQTVCNLCGADLPSFRRSILITVLVASAAFFTIDGMGYGIMLATRDTVNLTLPPGYNYLSWLREPLYLKWQVMGLVPVLRYLPIVFAVCLAATLYVLILGEPFRNCIVILLIQWTLNVVAMAVLSFLLSVTLGFVGHSLQPPSEGEAAENKTDVKGDKTPASDTNLKDALAARKGAAETSLNQTREHLRAFDERLEPYLEPIKTACAPYTKYLPQAVQAFLEDGGWWLVLAALAVAVGFWLRRLWRRGKRILFHKGRHHKKSRRSHAAASPLAIDLDLVADAFTDPGPRQITVRGQPGRLRLVILAPSSSYVGDLLPEMAEGLLDWLLPGLGEIFECDTPRCLVWPRHPSLGQFVHMFHQLVEIPEVKGRRSPWVLISGPAHLGRQSVFLGLAVFLDKTTYQRELQVDKEKWNEILAVQKVTEPV